MFIYMFMNMYIIMFILCVYINMFICLLMQKAAAYCRIKQSHIVILFFINAFKYVALC